MTLLLKLPAVQKPPRCEQKNSRNCTTGGRRRGIAHLVGFLMFAVVGGAVGAAAHHPAQFASGVNLVEVYATVMDARGNRVAGLTAGDFSVSEDGEAQAITTFVEGEFPLAVAVAIDRSFSMAGDRLALAKAAARTFLEGLKPGDQAMVLAVGSEVETAAPLSPDRAASRAAVDRLDAWGTTPLYDATLAALDAIQAAKQRRALVLLSDGTDRYSRTSASALLEEARRRDVLVYPVAIGGARPPVFAELAAATGGRSVFVKDARELRSTLASIASELRQQYLLGYTPKHAGDASAAAPANAAGRWHAIQVRVARPNVRVRARDGYYSK